MDYPVEIFAWVPDLETEVEEDTLTPIEEAEMDQVFSTAQAVLAEQNLTLKRTALSLTAEGDLPEVDEDEILVLEVETDAGTVETEEYQLLANFFYQEQEYAIYTPLDPLLFVARMKDAAEPELLSPEEFQKIQPILENQLFEEME